VAGFREAFRACGAGSPGAIVGNLTSRGGWALLAAGPVCPDQDEAKHYVRKIVRVERFGRPCSIRVQAPGLRPFGVLSGIWRFLSWTVGSAGPCSRGVGLPFIS